MTIQAIAGSPVMTVIMDTYVSIGMSGKILQLNKVVMTTRSFWSRSD